MSDLKKVLICATWLTILSSTASCEYEDPVYNSFTRMSMAEREKLFSVSDLNTQVKLYMLAMRDNRPRPVAYAVKIAEGGASNSGYVADVFEKTMDARDRVNLLIIFESMSDMGTFDVCKQEKTLQKLLPVDHLHGDVSWKSLYMNNLIDLCLRTKDQDLDAPSRLKPKAGAEQ